MLAKITRITLICLASLAAEGESLPEGTRAPDPAMQAEAAVAQNLKSEAGKKFSDSAAASAAAPLGAALRACRDSLSTGPAGAKPGTAGMDIYVMLNRRGMAKALLARPQGKMEGCMIGRLGGLAFPSPPGPNHWIKLRALPGPAQAPAAVPKR